MSRLLLEPIELTESYRFSGGTCSGGHGLSIGSVGGRDDNTVSGVVFKSSTVSNSQQGVRIKTKSGDTGTVSDITYEDITRKNPPQPHHSSSPFPCPTLVWIS